MVLVFTHCQPISYIWNEAGGAAGECGNLSAFAISSGIITAVADCMLLVLPMSILWSLRRPAKERLMLCGFFALSSLTLVASIARINYMSEVVSSVDFTFIELDTLVWSILEVDLGVICACIPTVKPLFKRKPTAKRSYTASYSGGRRSGTGFRSKPQTLTGKTTSTRSLDEYPLTNIEEAKT
ncbi:hypothetical protein K458DRAFT_9667 [Lentithecium fluviatile CBS 122367]|uniref:Rhodopsin domain-containing protein n=1 Tax=Lentithecium fluviatile CBS 122367 TaxID=1168545 RepID=A0A6G1JNE1_9PLEO|nr:hypothetical protein K458DRAFT_9667 [Lentithecium fluviatile CBS 122367]